MQDERHLLNRARALDPDALAAIHDAHYEGVYRYLSFRVDDVQTAEDLASEVFTRFLGALRDRNRPPNTIRGWLYGAAGYVVKEHYRRRKKQAYAPLDENLPSRAAGPEQRAEALMANEALRQAMATLTEEQQHILALRFGLSMPIKEVADAVGKSEGAVKMLQARAVAALTRQLDGGGLA